MAKQKRKLTKAQKEAKAKRRREYETIFINGKQKSVKRPPTIDGIPVDEFIMNNADPIWLHHKGGTDLNGTSLRASSTVYSAQLRIQQKVAKDTKGRSGGARRAPKLET